MSDDEAVESDVPSRYLFYTKKIAWSEFIKDLPRMTLLAILDVSDSAKPMFMNVKWILRTFIANT